MRVPHSLFLSLSPINGQRKPPQPRFHRHPTRDNVYEETQTVIPSFRVRLFDRSFVNQHVSFFQLNNPTSNIFIPHQYSFLFFQHSLCLRTFWNIMMLLQLFHHISHVFTLFNFIVLLFHNNLITSLTTMIIVLPTSTCLSLAPPHNRWPDR